MNLRRINNIATTIVAISATIILGLYLFELISSLMFLSVSFAIIINVINFLISTLLFTWSVEKSNTQFLLFNLGGMGIRLLFLLITIFIATKFLNVDIYGFILVFFIFYFMFVIMNVVYYHTMCESKKIKHGTRRS